MPHWCRVVQKVANYTSNCFLQQQEKTRIRGNAGMTCKKRYVSKNQVNFHFKLQTKRSPSALSSWLVSESKTGQAEIEKREKMSGPDSLHKRDSNALANHTYRAEDAISSSSSDKSPYKPENIELLDSGRMDPSTEDSMANGNANIDVNKNKQTKTGRVQEFKQGAEFAVDKTKSCCGNYWSDVCSVDNLKRRLPIINWLPKYRPSTFKCDVIAGLTVGLTVIPQGMAYADLAGLELQYGLYSAFMGSFLYVLLGTSKDITMGPTAIMSILVAEYAHDRWGPMLPGDEHTTNVTLAILLTLLSGVIQLLMAVFKLGFLVRYISHPVIVGFTSAASVVISMTQIKKIFGISTPRGFFETIYHFFRDIALTKHWDLILGLSSMVILYLLKYSKNRWSESRQGDKTAIKVLRKILWVFGTGRNAVIVIVSAAIAYGITDLEGPVNARPLTLTQNITGGVPGFAVPAFSYDVPNTNQTIYFPELISSLGSALAIIPLMGFLEAIAIAKAFGRKNNYKVDPTQELFAIGTSNLISSFVGSYPITGSFGRSAVNAQSNVMTPMGGIFTGAVVLLSLEFLSSAFQYIPEAALGAVIIMAVINLFDWNGMKHIWHVSKMDMIPLIVTFFLCFWDIAYGIIAGIGISILILLANHARPQAKITRSDSSVLFVIKRGLDFPGAEYIEEKLVDQIDEDKLLDVIVDCSNLTELDYSGAEAFLHGADAFRKHDIILKLCGLRRGHKAMLKRLNIHKIGVKFYNSVEEAKNESTVLPEQAV